MLLLLLLLSLACYPAALAHDGHAHELRWAHDIAYAFSRPHVAAGAPEQVWLNLGPQPTTMTVTWTTGAAANSTVQWGTDPTTPLSAQGTVTNYTTLGYASGFIHRASMTNLSPASRVFYRVSGPGGTFSDVMSYNVSRGVGLNFPFRLSVLGDTGQTNNTNSTFFHVLANRVESVVIAGDLSYADSDQTRWDSFQRMIQPLSSTIPVMVAPGNHEIEITLPNLYLAYQTRFSGMPSPPDSPDGPLYYSYETGPAHIIVLNAFGDFGPSSAQQAWLKKDVSAINYSLTPWVIAVLHTPFYCSNTAHAGSGDAMRGALEGIFVDAHVSLVIAGHIHAYERTANVVNSTLNPAGPMHITIGDGGNREGLYTKWASPSPPWSVFRASEYGGGILNFLNTTHALWEWHRNVDPEPIITDTFLVPNVYRA